MSTRDQFMPELQLRHLGFVESACGSFTNYRKRILIFKETDDLKHIYKNDLEKAWFAHNAAYANTIDFTKRTISDKILKDRTYEIAINSKYDEYQRELENMVYKFFDKKNRIRNNKQKEIKCK